MPERKPRRVEVSSFLEHPHVVANYLKEASGRLTEAHQYAVERERTMDRGELTGSVRDMIFGLNSALDGLVAMIEEGRFDERYPDEWLVDGPVGKSRFDE